MNKILLIGINARYSHPTMALYYLREHVRDLPWNVIIREFTIHSRTDEIIQCIEEEKAHCIGFSVYIWNTRTVQEVLKLIGGMRNRPKIILGGPDAGYNPNEWFRQFSFIDFIITGHGEEAFRRLLEQNINFNEKSLYLKNPPFSKIRFPYKDQDLEAFAHRKIYYETSRGCIFNCAYCLSSREDQRLEFRETRQVKDEIDLIMKHKPEIIKFVDRTFNANSSHARTVWEHIISKYTGTGTRFHFEIHPGLLKEDDFTLFAICPNNLFQFEIGIQSTCADTLRAVNRNGRWEVSKPYIKRLIDLGTIPIHIDLIAGLPFEDHNALSSSFNEAYSLFANHFQLGYLKVLPGTELREQAAEWGLAYTSDPPYEIIENRWIKQNEMYKIKIISKLVDLLYNSHSYKRTLENLISFYQSPFDFFEKFAEMKISNHADNGSMAWDDIARDLMLFASKHCEDDRFILDCLRWDWCSSSRTNRYPRMLKNDAVREIRKKILARLKSGHSIPGAEFLNEALARGSKIFDAGTDKFRSKYLAGKSCVLFLPDSHEQVFLD